MSATLEALHDTRDRAAARPHEPMWPLYAVLFASISIVIGLVWDISWHRTIGRDTFWSPPHVLEQLAAIVAGCSCGWLVLRTTFGAEQSTTVRIWGFRGPLGAWVCIWGTLMMIASAPFDNWWHNAYGLDVKVMSPPHMILAYGMVAIEIGAILMALARQNRATPAESQRLSFLYALSAGILLTMQATVLIEFAAFPNQMHDSSFYRITALAFPAILVAAARPARSRWGATTTAAIYMVITIVAIWTLELFRAQPKLAPIYNPVTHMVPPPFPLLLVVPALAIDLLIPRIRDHDWRLAALIGVSFVLLMLAAHWFFAEFLLSPAGRTFVFAADRWDYNIKVGDWRYQYWGHDLSVRRMGIAVLTAILMARLGLYIGSGMKRVQR